MIPPFEISSFQQICIQLLFAPCSSNFFVVLNRLQELQKWLPIWFWAIPAKLIMRPMHCMVIIQIQYNTFLEPPMCLTIYIYIYFFLHFQDNEPLMCALSKLIYVNSPDLVLFVGEALVGNDAVDQLSKFNQVSMLYPIFTLPSYMQIKFIQLVLNYM